MAAKLQPWYKVVNPRQDLRDGRPLDAAEFAVHLDQVRAGDARPDYQEPRRFFERTYLTRSLAELAGQVVRRLSGETVETSAVFNLSTQFGGGKTHALTLLYHLAASGPAADDFPGMREVLSAAGVTSVPKAAIGVFVGTEFDALQGRGGEDGTPRRRTPWGELAFQIGGAEAYRVVAEHDKEGSVPSCEVLRAFLPDERPCLILVDELMNYINRGRARAVGEQIYSFLHVLTEEARRHRNVVLAVSIPASELEMTPEDHADFDRLRKLLDRVGKPIAMSAGDETSEIIRRRLFEWEGLPREAMRTAGAYAQWVLDHRRQLPDWFPVDRAAEKFQAAYPFHPSLLSVFERKWQSLPRFQRTRGILRLLALWVSKAYERGYVGAHRDPVIGMGTAPLDDLMFRLAAFEQLGSDNLEAAVTADICGATDAHAVRLDADAQPTIGQARLHQKAAIAALFESNGGHARTYATEPEIRLAVSEPDLDLGNVETVLDQLSARCFYLAAENRRYRFSQAPNLNKLLSDRRASIDEELVHERIRQEIKDVFNDASGEAGKGWEIARCFFPEQSGQVDNRHALTLVVVDPATVSEGKASLAAWLRKMTMEYGASGRTFKSALVWCVPESGSSLADEARKLLAWEAIDAEKDTLHLDDHDRAQLGGRLGRAKRDLREAVWHAYRNLWLLGTDGDMHHLDLGLVTSSAATSMAALVVARLREGGEAEETIASNFLTRPGNWPPAFEQRGWPTKAVRDAFFASPQFPRLLSGNAIRQTIARGVSSGVFGYGDAAEVSDCRLLLCGEAMDPEDVDISDTAFIFRKELVEECQLSHAHPTPVVETPVPGKDPVPGPGVVPVLKQGDLPEEDEPDGGGAGAGVRWQGAVPWQKWTTFYNQVLSKFARREGVQIGVRFEVPEGSGLSPSEVAEVRAGLLSLGLSGELTDLPGRGEGGS